MKYTVYIVLIFILYLTTCKNNPTKSDNDSNNLDSTMLYLGQIPPGMEPVRFATQEFLANSEWFWHGSPCFSPDLKEMYFVKYPTDQSAMRIYVTRLINNQWSTPAVASFSTFNAENNPFITQDGNSLYFIANTQNGNKIFSVSKTQNGWSDPTQVNIPIPTTHQFGWQFSMSRNGDLYFELWGPNYEPPDLYKSILQNGQYTQAIKLDSNINTEYNEFAPYIDPNEEFIIFESNRPGGYGLHDMYISFSDSNGNWTEAVNLGNTINTSTEDGWANISPDGKYFFYVTAKTGDDGFNPYWISSQFIDDLKPDTLFNPNTVTDIDGNVYNTVKIGSQVWMVENLRTTRFNDGVQIPNVTNDSQWMNLSTPGYCWYDNNISNKEIYGGLYNWYAVNTGKLAPTGWHVPTLDEWETLINYLGGENIAGDKLKETGTTHWLSPNTGSTNESGFTALGAGVRDITFIMLLEANYIWSSTPDGNDTQQALQLHLHQGYSWANLYSMQKYSGFTVRCIKD